MSSRNVKLVKTCFVVSPIGQEDSTIRERSDKILKYVIRPVCEEMGYHANRIDEVPNSFLISKKIIECLLKSDLVIADLTGSNPNVFYELAVRHFVGKPIIHIMEQNHKVPFDLKDCNITFIDHKDLESVEQCKNKLKILIRHIEKAEIVDNPITNVLLGMNINIAELFHTSRKDVLQQFEELSKLIINELGLFRSERKLFLEKIMRPNQNIESGVKIDFSGLWNSNNGLVRIVQDDVNVFGEYQFGADSWVGFINGRIIDNKIIFRWIRKESSFEGVGYWQINENRLEGRWGYGDPSFTELLKNPDLISELIYMGDWNLWKET